MLINTPIHDIDGQIGDMDGFSKRLNYLLDKTGFVRGRGRLTDFSSFVGERKTKTRNWLQNDMYPRGNAMRDILNLFYEQGLLPSSIEKNRLELWLEKGEDLAQNPFKTVSTATQSKDIGKTRSKVYFIVYEVAKSMGMDIYKYSDELLDVVFKEIFTAMDQDGSVEPSARLIQQSLKRLVQYTNDTVPLNVL